MVSKSNRLAVSILKRTGDEVAIDVGFNVGQVLANESDPLFSWQYDPSYKCPKGCSRDADATTCTIKED